MSNLVLLRDGVDGVALPPVTDGAVQLIRLGQTQDVYGFGALTTTLGGSLDLPMTEGTAGPAQVAGEAAVRVVDGVDTDDNAADWTTSSGGSPGASNASP
jgi:hypothetical protein